MAGCHQSLPEFWVRAPGGQARARLLGQGQDVRPGTLPGCQAMAPGGQAMVCQANCSSTLLKKRTNSNNITTQLVYTITLQSQTCIVDKINTYHITPHSTNTQCAPLYQNKLLQDGKGIFNRPGVAGAVLQTTLSFIDSFSQSSHSSFLEISSKHLHYKSVL